MNIDMQDSTENPRRFGDPEDAEMDEGPEKATEEEQLMYDLLVSRARKMIFGESKEKILTMLGSSESPAKAIGQVGSMLLKSLIQSGKAAGKEISADIAINAGTEVADDLNELGKAKGIFKYDSQKDEDDELAQAVLWGVKFYGDGMVKDGEITPEMKKMAAEQMQKGIESEGGPKKKPIAAAVGQEMNKPAGLVGGAMGGM